jgi:hypothetical protein
VGLAVPDPVDVFHSAGLRLGHRADDQFQDALPGRVAQRLLAAMAHQPLQLAPRLPLHFLGGNRGGEWKTYRKLMLPMFLAVLLMFHLVCFSWLLFRAQSMT